MIDMHPSTFGPRRLNRIIFAMTRSAKARLATFVSALTLVAALGSTWPTNAQNQQLQPLYRFNIQTNNAQQNSQVPPPPAATFTVSIAPLSQNIFVGEAYLGQALITGQAGNVTFSLIPIAGDAAALGLTFANGQLTGRPMQPGDFTYQVRATETATGASAMSNLATVTVAARTLAYTNGANFFVGDTVTSTAPTTNIPSPSFAAGGGFPGWASVNPTTGVITGVAPPNAGGQTVSFPVTATAGPYAASASWQANIITPVVTLNQAPSAVGAGQAVSFSANTNMPNPVTWSLSNAPAWLSINPTTGLISGTAVNGQPVTNATVRATRGGATATATLSIPLRTPIAMTYPQTVYYPDRNSNFSSGAPTVTGGGGGTNVFSVFSGTMPAGLTLNTSTGVISGRTTATAETSVVIRVTDGVTSANYPLTMRPQAVVASTQCFVGQSGSYSIPAYNKLTITAIGAGGAGGGVTPGTMNNFDGAAGSETKVYLGTRELVAPGGYGGKTASPNGFGGLTGSALPTNTLTNATLTRAVYGSSGASFVKAASFPATAGRGGSTSQTQATTPSLPAMMSGTAWSRQAPAGAGVGGHATCYAPSTADLQTNPVTANWQGWTAWCGQGGSSGAEATIVYDRSINAGINTGTELNFYTGTGGAPTAPEAGRGGHGSVCFQVE
jgi:large repetitive protein